MFINFLVIQQISDWSLLKKKKNTNFPIFAIKSSVQNYSPLSLDYSDIKKHTKNSADATASKWFFNTSIKKGFEKLPGEKSIKGHFLDFNFGNCARSTLLDVS